MKYKQVADNIIQYLKKNDIVVDEFIRWQGGGGFDKDTDKYGLTLFVTIKTQGKEESYSLPKWLKYTNIEPPIAPKFLKYDYVPTDTDIDLISKIKLKKKYYKTSNRNR